MLKNGPVGASQAWEDALKQERIKKMHENQDQNRKDQWK
jgi:hypothetical protein